METSAFDLLFKRNVPHILEKIFLSMDYDSFKSCLMVSKMWNQLLTSESFKRKGKSRFDKWLFKAAVAGQVDSVHLLLQLGAEPDKFMSQNSGRTALHWAVTLNHIDVVKVLLDRGADPNRGDIHERSSLHYAARNFGCRDVVNMLLNKGGDKTKKDNLGESPKLCSYQWIE